MPDRPERARPRAPEAPPSFSRAQLEALIEEAIVDAYGESEQAVAFATVLEDSLALPFTTEVLGVPVVVERVDTTDRDEIAAYRLWAGGG